MYFLKDTFKPKVQTLKLDAPKLIGRTANRFIWIPAGTYRDEKRPFMNETSGVRLLETSDKQHAVVTPPTHRIKIKPTRAEARIIDSIINKLKRRA